MSRPRLKIPTRKTPLPWARMFWLLFGLFSLGVVVSFLGATTLTTPGYLVFFFCAGWAGSLVGAAFLIARAHIRTAWFAVAWLYAGLVMVIAPFMIPPSILVARGEPVTATIIGSRHLPRGSQLLYTLDGVPGVLEADDTHSIGDKVSVVVDPDGLIHPMLPSDTDGSTAWDAPIGMAVLALLLALFCWLAAKPRSQPRPNPEPDDPLDRFSRRTRIQLIPGFQLVFGPLLIVASLFLWADWWHNFNLDRNGVRGTVTPASCVNHYGNHGTIDSYTCTGEFVSDDGRLRLDKVAIEPDLKSDKDSVPAKLIDNTASHDAHWGTQLFGALAFLAIGVWRIWMGISLWRSRRLTESESAPHVRR